MQLEMIMDSEENVSTAESTEAMDTLPQLSRKQEMERLVKVQKQHRDCGRMHAAFIKEVLYCCTRKPCKCRFEKFSYSHDVVCASHHS